ncbi:hypothetical protein [uncultured Nostoc sp.]|uniref:hypothetical protein n=1 Tax=uncultured Nostoc sp. TaxID=340711 RepID=UPI0035C943EE
MAYTNPLQQLIKINSDELVNITKFFDTPDNATRSPGFEGHVTVRYSAVGLRKPPIDTPAYISTSAASRAKVSATTRSIPELPLVKMALYLAVFQNRDQDFCYSC